MEEQQQSHASSGEGQNERNGDESEFHFQTVLAFPIGVKRVIARINERVRSFVLLVCILRVDGEGNGVLA